MKIAVIGGGAAGLMAAWAAADAGASVTLFEKNEKCGKKIYITGKGRCNVTNDCDEREYLSHVVNGSKFLTSAVYAFSPRALMEHLEDGGLRLKTERGNRVFPVSDKASDVTKCLENYCRSVGVNIKFNTKVLNLDILNSTMCDIITANGAVSFDKVIVCTGGKSYPSTGSDSDGYVFAERAGHTVIKPVPSLCGVNLNGGYFRAMQGLSLKNVGLKVYSGGKLLKDLFGEMQFTHFGASGPLILTASALINRLSHDGVKLVLDFKPALSREQLEARILRDFEADKNKDISNCLKSLLPSSAVEPMLERCGILPDKKVNSITRAERASLLTNIKNFDMLYLSLRGFEEAVVTSGGVSLKEVNPKTMESKIVKGLYFCGEVLDCDAFTGGFNLQIAFSTGYVAGRAAAQADN